MVMSTPGGCHTPLPDNILFFPHAHHTYSRIDYLIVNITFIPSIVSTQYTPITISDHSTLILDLHFDLKPKGFKFWRLDPILLAEVDFCKYVSIKIFLDTNRNETSASLLWETLKADVRGKIISFTSHANRARKARRAELERAIADLDNLLSTYQLSDLHKERMVLHTELDLLLTKEAEQLLLRALGSMYEHGDKTSHLLAHQLKSRMASNQITQIRYETGSLTSDPEKINNTFRKFYSQLYKSEFSNDEAQFIQFFEKLVMPKISDNDHEMLDFPLQLSEIKEAIQLMNNGKSPGPNGYPVEFYKKFSDQLFNHL